MNIGHNPILRNRSSLISHSVLSFADKEREAPFGTFRRA